ncbi:hypothetical protein ACGIF2_15160 [Cellulomonas sp. P22]|uniref:hypothetical protein n=1 Tax=Cellulomonas sp. P22 TaxID=3373189 RepID=UPI0037877589
MTSDADREIDALRRLLREHGLIEEHEPATADVRPADSIRLARRVQAEPAIGQRRWGTLVALTAAAACLVFIAAVVVTWARPEPAQAAATPRMLTYTLANPAAGLESASPAGRALTTAAQRAASQPDAAADGDVQYTASYGWSLSITHDKSATTSRLYPTFTRFWLAPDGSATRTQSRGAELDIEGREVAGGPMGVGGTDTLPVGSLDAGLVTALAERDSLQAVEDGLLALSPTLACDQDPRWHAQCLVEAIQQVYGLYVVPADLAGSFWQVLASEVAVKDLGVTTDRLGRPAWAVALPSDPDDPVRSTNTVLLISQATGQLSGVEVITRSDTVSSVSEPTVTTFTAWTVQARVQRVGAEP